MRRSRFGAHPGPAILAVVESPDRLSLGHSSATRNPIGSQGEAASQYGDLVRFPASHALSHDWLAFMSAALKSKAAVPAADSDLERRRHERLDFRTAVVAIEDRDDGLYCVRCQSDDLSFEGARLVCFEPLSTTAVYLRILMPGLSERFVEADIMNERVHTELRFGSGLEKRYIYGVRFRRVVTETSLIERLHAAAAPPVQAGNGAGI